jgi:hypothetical protein
MLRIAHRLSSLICLAAVLTAGGGHWAVLQTFAWARMLVEYSTQNSLAEAVEMTFDGKHPCPMCLKIEKGRKQERRQPMNAEMRKLDLFCESRYFADRCAAWWLDPGTPFLSSLYLDFTEAPPRPPPRLG